MSLACRNESAYKMQATVFMRPLSGLYVLCERIRITITLSSWHVLLSVPVYAICIWCAFIFVKAKGTVNAKHTHTRHEVSYSLRFDVSGVVAAVAAAAAVWTHGWTFGRGDGDGGGL